MCVYLCVCANEDVYGPVSHTHAQMFFWETNILLFFILTLYVNIKLIHCLQWHRRRFLEITYFQDILCVSNLTEGLLDEFQTISLVLCLLDPSQKRKRSEINAL